MDNNLPNYLVQLETLCRREEGWTCTKSFAFKCAFVIISQVDFISVLLCGCAAAEILFTALRSLKMLRLLGLQLIVQMSETSMWPVTEVRAGAVRETFKCTSFLFLALQFFMMVHSLFKWKHLGFLSMPEWLQEKVMWKPNPHHRFTNTLSNIPLRDIADDPQPTTLSFYAQYRGSHLCGANARRRNNAARCKRELHFYCSVAPERLLNSLWKCWQKRSRFNKACSSGEEQQPTVRWGGWVWPLDFNDGPVISLCQPTV